MALENRAAWSLEKGQPLKIDKAEVKKPGPGEILVKNHAIAINPVNVVQLNIGMFVSKYPAIFGNDVAGEAIEIGEGVTNIKKGQRVFANSVSIMTNKAENGGFQNYTLVQANGTCPIPDSISFEQAAVAPLAISTAAAGLYASSHLGLPYPTAKPAKTGKSIIVWGGASSVGTMAIQLSVASGFDVYATASKKNFQYCKDLGAKEVFDYGSPSIVDDLTAALKGTEVAGAYDSIAKEYSTEPIAQVLSQLGGGKIATTLPIDIKLPSGVAVFPVFGPSVVGPNAHVGDAVYKEFLPDAVASGKYKLLPKAKVVGHSLEDIQEAVQLYAKGGNSAVKLVVTL